MGIQMGCFIATKLPAFQFPSKRKPTKGHEQKDSPKYFLIAIAFSFIFCLVFIFYKYDNHEPSIVSIISFMYDSYVLRVKNKVFQMGINRKRRKKISPRPLKCLQVNFIQFHIILAYQRRELTKFLS